MLFRSAGSRCVYSIGLARVSAGGAGRALASSVACGCFAGGDLSLRRRRSGGVLAWICCLRHPRSLVLPWATSPCRRSKTATSAFGVLDSARVEASLRCDRWSRMEALRSSSSDDFPSAWGHLPIQGQCGDAAAARRRCVLLFVGGFALQKKGLVVVLYFVEVLSVIDLL